MKRYLITFAVFLFVFILTYLIMSFAIPGMRIKLDAVPMEYFFASITHMAFFKALISLATGVIAGLIPIIIIKKK